MLKYRNKCIIYNKAREDREEHYYHLKTVNYVDIIYYVKGIGILNKF